MKPHNTVYSPIEALGFMQVPIQPYNLGSKYLSPKKVNLSIMVGLYKPQKVKGYLPSY